MPYSAFLSLSRNLSRFREEEAAYISLAVWGRGEDGGGDDTEVADYETPEDLRRLFGGM